MATSLICRYAASSIYHAAQFSVRRTIGSLNLSVAYTYSHSIDDSSDRFDASFVDSANPSRQSCQFQLRSAAHLERQLRLGPAVLQEVRDLPTRFWVGGNSPALPAMQSGTPFSLIASGRRQLYRQRRRGQRTGQFRFAPRPGRRSQVGRSSTATVSGFGPLLYNPAAFALPRGLTFGDAGRNILNQS